MSFPRKKRVKKSPASVVMAGLDPAIQELTVKGSYFVYILASERNGTRYTGVTNDLTRRTYQHKQGEGSAFTKRYRVHRLVYAEEFSDITLAIQRESNLKHWPRSWKIELIEEVNPDWTDLYETIV